ncbi:hypothetical protein GcM1_04594 [Golovinomyces cichoracearum]|uniref:Uncharacterized protein n=1 Tax=Golovinomyces cichoracearum TaxID=62708 RepID=A0A420IW53_9PEZI|nr:hypothetical protein GcM1_04594 [Golovinomyces cichoracearum]
MNKPALSLEVFSRRWMDLLLFLVGFRRVDVCSISCPGLLLDSVCIFVRFKLHRFACDEFPL